MKANQSSISKRRRLLLENLERRSLLAGDFGFINAMGSTGQDLPRSVVTDATGNSYITGQFSGTVNFDPLGGLPPLISSNESLDCFIAKYSPTGAAIWSKRIGGTTSDWGVDLAFDPSGNLYVGGRFSGTVDLDPSPANAVNRTNVGAADLFFVQLDPNGNYLSSGAFGGENGETLTGIAVDSSGNLYLTGQYNGLADFDPTIGGTSNLTSNASFDPFLSKISPAGTLLWARSFGGTAGNEISNGVDIDDNGSAYIAGQFGGTVDFDPGPLVTSITSNGANDMFVSKFNASGDFVWARAFSGASESQINGIAVDAEGSVVTTGQFQSTIDFDPGVGQVNLTATPTFFGAFVSKLDTHGNYLWAVKLTGTGTSAGFGVCIDKTNGDIYSTGQFGATCDFDPSSFAANLTATLGGASPVDIYVSRLDKGGRYVDARKMGGPNLDRGLAIAVNPITKAIYTAGEFAGTADFDPGSGTISRTSANNPTGGNSVDIFLSKLIQSQVGGRVWNDLNQNGLQEAGEPAIAGARIEVVTWIDGVLGNNDDRSIGDLVSDTNGNFLYTLPHFGPYTLRFYPPTGEGKGYRFTNSNLGDDNLDSDVIISDGTSFVAIPPGQTVLNVGAGLIEVPSNIELALSLGGSGEQRGRSVARDSDGNVLVTGTFTTDSIDLDPSPNSFILTNRGGDDAFVAKYDPDGQLMWARGLGSTLSDSLLGVAVDVNGNVFVTGNSGSGAYFGPGTGEAVIGSSGQRDIFAAKLSPSGSILWTQRVGSSADEGATALALDASGDVYITGVVTGLVDFDPGPGTIQPPSSTATDTFVWKLSSSGTAQWAVRSAGAGIDQGNAIAVSGGSVYVAGQYQTTVDFDPSLAATVNRTSAGFNDGYVWQLSTAAGAFQSVVTYGATGNDFATGVALDPSGNLYVTGTFENTVDFDPSLATSTLTATNSDVFVTKRNSAGTFLWAKNPSGGGVDASSGISVDQSGRVWVTGRFVGTSDFDPSTGAFFMSSSSGIADSFVWGLDDQGAFRNAFRLGGAGFDAGAAIVVSPLGDRVYSTGEFAQQVDFDPQFALLNLISFATASPVSTQNAYLWAQGLNTAPSNITLAGDSVPEQSANGTLVGNLGYVDPDPGDPHTFTLLDSAGGRFAIFGSQLFVADGALLDYESQINHSITIRVTDGLGESFTKSFTINVVNVNEAPFDLALDNNSVDENSTTGTLVGLLSASDFDAGDTLAFTILDDVGGRFAVTGNQVVVANSALLDYEASTTHTIVARVTDAGGLFQDQTFVINVLNVNEAPLVSLGNDLAANEGDLVTVSASFTDPDQLDSWFATVDYGDGGGPQSLALNPDKTLSLAHAYEDDGSYTVTVVVTDAGGLASTDTLVVAVSNVVPQNVNVAGPSSGVRGQALSFIGSFTDPGTADTHQVAWDFGDGGQIALHPSTDAGALTSGHTYAASGVYTVTFTVVDDDGGVSTFSYQVTIVAAGLQADPCDPSGTALVVGGTAGADTVRVLPATNNGVEVFLGNTSLGTFQGLSRILVYGQAGNDDIQAAGSIGLDMWFFGGDGADKLKGGSGNDVLLGEAGNDQMLGHQGRDLLVGGAGADQIQGNADEDILIAGDLSFADLTAALCDIMDEWTSGRSYEQRIENLKLGTSSERANGSTLLLVGQSILDDAAADHLSGASGNDWFFFTEGQDTSDMRADESLISDLEWL